MTQVRFGNASPKDPFLYKWAQRTYEMPEKAGSAISKRLGDNVGGFVKNQLNCDFAHFTNVEVGNRFKTMLAEPPKLPLLFLLYPATVGPRLYRAWERGKENNDYREMGDVLRRDLTAITLFVFALGPMVKATSKAVQLATGVNLLDTKSGNVLTYSQFKNYEIADGKALWQVVKEGNGRGLKNAMNRLGDGGLNKHGYTELDEKLKGLKSAVADLVKNHSEKDDQTGLKKATEIYGKHFKGVKDEVERVINTAARTENKSVVAIAQKLQGQTKDALKNYAKVRRLPTDMFAFAVMVVAIGWFPMAFNGWYNKRKFEEEMASKGGAGQGVEPAVAQSPSSQVAMPTMRTQLPAAQPQPLKLPQPFGQTASFASFPAYNAQLSFPVNPFIRTV